MRKRSTTITLTLRRQWFDLIKHGVKLEEYREIKETYIKRFCTEQNKDCPWLNPAGAVYFKIRTDFDTLVFTLGYPKKTDTERRLVFKNPKIEVRTGKPEWGAVPGEKYFVITWDKGKSDV